MIKSDMTIHETADSTALHGGSLYRVINNLPTGTVTLLDQNQAIQVPASSVWPITVPHAAPLPVKTYGTKVVLAFDDSSTAQYLAHVKESISILSPLSFFVTSSSGSMQGSVSPSLITAAKENSVQVWPIVESGFHPNQTTSLLESPQANWNLVSAIINAVQSDHLDGINLDFEDMIPSDTARLTRLVDALSLLLHAMGKGLSVDVTPPSSDPNWGIVYDRKAIAQAADYEVVMTYDEHYQGDPVPGSTSSIPWMKQGIDNTVNLGVPKSKILMGIPFYTLDWTYSSHAWNSTYIGINQALADTLRQGATITWNPADGQNVLHYTGSQEHTVWLENAVSLNERGEFVVQSGVAGVGIWQLGLGQPSDLSNLLKAFH